MVGAQSDGIRRALADQNRCTYVQQSEPMGTAHRAYGAAATLATAVLPDPCGYARVIRDQDGQFIAIVEQKDASSPQRLIQEVNPSYYCFRSDSLFEAFGARQPFQ